MTVLSEPDSRVPRVLCHPWRALGRLTDVTIRWERTPDRLGSWCERTRTITLHPGQTQAERRSTAAHEAVHAERGHSGPCTPALDRAVHAEAARRLITLDALVDALLWSQDEHELADELWCDVPTVLARLAGLSDDERAEVERRMDDREGAA